MTNDDGVAFITGGASGMGRLAARNLAAAGMKVAAADIDEQGLLETAEADQRIRTWNLDVTDAARVAAVVDELLVFPGRGTRTGWRLRRFFPELLWKRVHAAEGA